jgi:hypothetical protein
MASVGQVEELLAIYRFLHVNSAPNAKDHVLRAALTMMVSTIDTTAHELIVTSIMRKMSNNELPFDITKQTISLQCLSITNVSQRTAAIEADLRRQYSKETFQSSRQLETALANIGINKIWSRLAARLGKTPEQIKLELDLMVRRRNQIVHEADLDGFHCLHPITISTIENLFAFTNLFLVGLFDEYEALG